jgi:dimethylamine monooxygenase subunit C
LAFMLAPSIKSRPVYGVLTPQPGSTHILAADNEGALAIVDLAEISPPTFFGHAQIMFVCSSALASNYGARLRALGASAFYEGPSITAALPRLTQVLSTARMGTRLYLAGTEGLIGQSMRVAIEAGIDPASIVTEHRGSLNRRVQCVHCKGITENVTHQPAVCSHCGLTLFVRDHYSRRIAAFQGVCIDAEEPGMIPPAEEIFR